MVVRLQGERTRQAIDPQKTTYCSRKNGWTAPAVDPQNNSQVVTGPAVGPSRNRPLDPFTLAVNDCRCLRAFLVVLRDSRDDGKKLWITSIKELQMASLLFCAACRDLPARRLGVSRRIPPHLLSAAHDDADAGVWSSSLEDESSENKG